MSKKSSFIESMLLESKAYQSIDQVLNELEVGQDLSSYPIEPLFILLKDLDAIDRSLVLTKLSSDQRQALFDLAAWDKDQLDITEAGEWLVTYAHCKDDDLRWEFVQTQSFLTFLKGRFNIWTFDAEEPEYPDHDYYFITDDNQLLLEYDEDFLWVSELKSLVGDLYSALGPEKAYQLLFQYVSESYSLLEEEEYQKRRSRLQDLGFIDYFDSLPFVTPFPSEEHLQRFILNREGRTGNLDTEQLIQNLHHYSLKSFEQGLDVFHQALNEVQDEKRIQFLKFDFIRTVNSKLSFENALKGGRMRTEQMVSEVKNSLLMGYEHLSQIQGTDIFSKFLFSEIYKVGLSLVSLEKNKVKKLLSKSIFGEDNDIFFGAYFNRFLDLLFQTDVKVQDNYYDNKEKQQSLSTEKSLLLLKEKVQLFTEIMPFMESFYKTYKKLCEEQYLQDDYYLNYSLSDIDFEAILISSVMNFHLGDLLNYQKKLGLSIKDLIEFCKKNKTLSELFPAFAQKFGLDQVPGIEKYFSHLIQEHLAGYQFDEMKEAEFKFVGGPIILKGH